MDEAKIGRPFREVHCAIQGVDRPGQRGGVAPRPRALFTHHGVLRETPGELLLQELLHAAVDLGDGSRALALPLILDVKGRLEVLQEHRSSPPRQIYRLLLDFPERLTVQWHRTSLRKAWPILHATRGTGKAERSNGGMASGLLASLAQEGPH